MKPITATLSQPIIAYYRVSTKRQGDSGLGLEAQQAVVEEHAQRNGCRLLGSYVEVESGKKADRTELRRALSHARRSKAVLVVAKLDRLARNVAFLSALMESGVEFIACDNPHANRLTIHILAAVAEDEARRTSERTKAALQAAKRRGVKLGSTRKGHWEGREQRRSAGATLGAQRAAEAHRKAADEAYADLVPLMQQLKAQGESLRGIATKLNDEGYTTRQGRQWGASTVRNVLMRFEGTEAGKV